MAASSLTVPDHVSFEQAIGLTQSLLEQQFQGNVTESELTETIRALVQTENGARGFFVTFLSDDRPEIDPLLPIVTPGLNAAPEIVSPLLVKNLSMSTAMAIAHRRQQHEALAQGSDRVRSRTLQILQSLQLPQIRAEADKLAVSLRTGAGDYRAFLDRWGYDAEQRQAIGQALEQAGLLPPSSDPG
jgi:hypothetical protein